MHYVLFTGSTPASKRPLGSEYYSTLQPIVQNIEGFIEEIGFGDPTNPEGQCLFARYTDAAALTRWRNHPTHLKIMHDARHNVFERFRIVVGTDNAAAVNKGESERTVVVYLRPVVTDHGEELEKLMDVVEKGAKGILTESKFYVAEKLLMSVSRLQAGADVAAFEASLERGPGDALYRLRVVREYSKEDRKEAPRGIDEAEAEAGA